jgi:hypothetical protein
MYVYAELGARTRWAERILFVSNLAGITDKTTGRRRNWNALVTTTLFAASLLGFPAGAQTTQIRVGTNQPDSGFGKLDPSPPKDKKPEEIIREFAAKESVFKKALEHYTWTQDIRVQTLDGNKVDGEYHVVYNVTFDAKGARTEHVIFAPMNTLERIMMTEQDVDDIEHRLPFVLTAEDIVQYDVTYAGKQKVDDVETYVFDVRPKVMEKKKRYFQGRIWVDEQDLQILITSGRSVPDDTRPGHEDLSPPFTTYREQVDGKYWFPTYTKGEGELHFHATKYSPSEDVSIRQIVKYTDYKQFGSSFRVIFDGEAPPQDGDKPSQQKNGKPAPNKSPQNP